MRSKLWGKALLPLILFSQTALAQTDEEKIAQLRESAARYKAESQKYFKSSPSLILPEGMEDLPGFRVTKNATGRNSVLPSGDPEYVRCMGDAWKTFGLVSGAGLVAGGLPGAVIGISAGGAQAILDAQTCAGDNVGRLFDALAELEAADRAKGISIQVGTFSKEITGVEGELTELRGAVLSQQLALRQEMRKSLAELMAKAVSREDVEKIVGVGMMQIKDATRKHFLELKTKQAAVDEANQLRANIQLTQQGLTSFVGIAFRSNPALVNKLNRGINGAAQLAQIGIALSVAANPFSVVMLSLSAMGVMNSIFGGGDGGAAFNQVVLDNIQALREDIADLRGEMHTRFNTIERSLVVVAEYVRTGFTVVEGKLDQVRFALNDVREENEIRARLQESAVANLLGRTLNISAQRCLEGDASLSINRNSFGNCLGDFKIYGTDIARLDMISGSGRIASDPLGTVSNKFYLTVDSGNSLGYFSALDRAIKGGPIVADAPSPLEWVRGTQAYLSLMDRYSELAVVRSEVSRAEIIRNEQANIRSMIKAGEEIKAKARYLRREGAITLLDLYQLETQKWMNALAPTVVQELAKRPLGVTKEQVSRKEWVIQVGGHSSVFSPCGSVSREIVGIDEVIVAENDKQIVEAGERCWPSTFTNKDNDAQLKQYRMAFVRNQADSVFDIKPTKSRDDAAVILQLTYLKRQKLSKFSPQVREMFTVSLDAALRTAESQAALSRLGYLQELMLQQAMVGADDRSDPELGKKVAVIQSLAVSAPRVRELMGQIQFVSDKPLGDVFAEEMNRIFDLEKTRISDALKGVSANDAFPFIEPSMRRLRALRTASE